MSINDDIQEQSKETYGDASSDKFVTYMKDNSKMSINTMNTHN